MVLFEGHHLVPTSLENSPVSKSMRDVLRSQIFGRLDHHLLSKDFRQCRGERGPLSAFHLATRRGA